MKLTEKALIIALMLFIFAIINAYAEGDLDQIDHSYQDNPEWKSLCIEYPETCEQLIKCGDQPNHIVFMALDHDAASFECTSKSTWWGKQQLKNVLKKGRKQ